MEDLELTSYLRSLRRRAGFSQRDLAELIGYLSGDQVSRHERADSLPSLLAAFSYEIVFRVPVADLFPGVYATVKQQIEERLSDLERELGESSAKGRKAPMSARKLEWFNGRNNLTQQSNTDAKANH
jgi:transcriptional regulator with XRE-family HTH domain